MCLVYLWFTLTYSLPLSLWAHGALKNASRIPASLLLLSWSAGDASKEIWPKCCPGPPWTSPIYWPHNSSPSVSLSMPSSRYFHFPSTFLAICNSRAALNYLIYYCQEWKAQSDGTCGHTVHTLPTRLWKARERWTLTVHPGDNGYWTWPHCLIFFYAKTIISLYIMLSISIF